MSENLVCYEAFHGSFLKAWDTLFAEAAAFASQVGEDRLINISHSAQHSGHGIVTVWYWRDAPK